jgi:deazaflavin-dependent oxidoreductase (nitroreductase family)
MITYPLIEMARSTLRTPASDLPAGLGQPARRALSAAGYTHLDQFTKLKESDLLKLHGLGPKAIELIRSTLQARGQSLADARGESGELAEPILDSPRGWVKSHIQTYVESAGKQGHRWRGLPTLLLTTRGRRTGQRRRTALIYGRDGDHYLLVPSNGGARQHPLWFLNLVENPEVEIQVGADKFIALARVASPKEKPRLWQIMAKIFSQYDQYQSKAAKAGRQIPVVVIEPIS